MLVTEDAVLRPKNPDLQNSDEWPNFLLTNVHIVNQQSGQQVSLLSAHKRNPVRVIGQLDEVEDEYRSLVRDDQYQCRTIELRDVNTYAFAEYEDRTKGFWAAGNAGWFEIVGVASTYKSIHNEMLEAASMLYMLADKLRRSRRQKLTGKELRNYIKRLFRDYLALAQVRDPIRFADVDDVREAFHGHRKFLITSMLEGQESLDWNDTPMLTYFETQFPEDVEMIRSRIFQNLPPDENIVANARKRKSESPHVDEATLKKRKGRPPKDPRFQQPRTLNQRPSDQSFSEDDDDSNNNVMNRNRKSILRPSGNRSAKKAKQINRCYQSPSSLNESMDSGGAESDGSEKTPYLQDSSITFIKDGEHLELISNPIVNQSRSSTSPPPQFLPRKYLELRVVDYNLPTMEPQGPGDLWSCTFDGCGSRVHKASTESGKTRIKDHWRTHASQAQEKIDLALDESRPYLPVNNLVRRLQAFAPKPGDESDPDSLVRKFSAPIRRRY